MAYFLPSYLQKRLLRYALTRVDLIETDDLDLEDLGLTFGQRSVVELKNVSIKAKRLAERANLPPSVLIDRATIRLLRLTVPADLHASGIIVEVEGINIQVRMLQEEQQLNPNTSPSHTDKANRPRISSPPLHDPGGARRHNRKGHHVEVSKVLPTSRDLAASFLESEPVEEKQELEAALESQSRLHESTASSGFGDESDLGMAGGLTLPSFVASFFQGVADRLSVTIKDVVITVQLCLSSDDSDNTTFTLKLGAVNVEAAALAETDFDTTKTSRKISVQDVRFGLEAEPDTLSQTSSPRLERGSFREVPPYASQHAAASPPNGSSTFDSRNSQQVLDLNASLTDFQTSPDPSVESSRSDSNSAFFQSQQGPAVLTTSESESVADTGDIDNKAYAEMFTTAGPPSPESERTSSSSNGNKQLSESKLFSHAEAESMYMSAISGDGLGSTTARPMPGGWDWSDSIAHQESTVEDSGPLAATEVHEGSPPAQLSSKETSTAASSATPPREQPSSIAPLAAAVDPEETHSATTIFIQILKLDAISITLPTDLRSPGAASGPTETSSPTRTARKPLPIDRAGASLAYSTTDQHLHEDTSGQQFGIGIHASTLTLDADLRICKHVVKVAQGLLKRSSPFASPTPPPNSAGSTASTADLQFSLDALLINFREASSPSSNRSSPSRSGLTPSKDEPLLCLSLSSMSYLQRGTKRKTLSISRIAVRHNSRDVLFFVDAVNVRDFIAGSAMLKPHDLSLTTTDSRVEVQVKPVHVILDLLIIDDVLSRSGGLSSLIDLGNSIASTSTVTKSTVPVKPPALQQRTVRFNDPHQRARSQSDPSSVGSKMNVRIGGAIIDLVGSEASMQIKSSAVKLALRDGQARVVIDGAVVEGPLLPSSKSPPGVYIKAKSLDIRYLDVPEETDLDRLLSLITPSSDRYDNDDDIMVETLLRQRRKGGVLRLAIGETSVHARGLDWQASLVKLSDEISKLSSVAKYLPEDDRPGILTFALINKFDFRVDLDQMFGPLSLRGELIEGAHINVPSLAAAQVSSWTLARGKDDVLIGEVLSQSDAVMGPPMLMCRFVADEMEPTVRLKLSNTCLEYKVATVIALTDVLQRSNQHDTSSPPKDALSRHSSPSASSRSEESSSFARKVKVSTAFRDSAIALHPTGSPAKGLFVLSDATIGYDGHKHNSYVTLELKKASLLIINNTEVLGEGINNADQKLYFDQNDQIQQLAKHGFVLVGSMSSALAVIKISQDQITQDQHLDVEFRNNLLFLETCADSTQTLIQILNGLSPPTPPSSKAKYRTEVVPIQDMLASFTGNAFVTEPGPNVGLQASQVTATTSNQDQEQYDEQYEDEYEDGGFMNDLYAQDDEAEDEMSASYVESEIERSTASLHIAPVEVTAPDEADLAQSMIAHSMLDFRTDHFATKTAVEGTAHHWDSTKDTYGLASDTELQRSPLKVRIRDVHIIWNLFDGYDWQATRDTISHAVKEIETKAMMRRPRSGTRSPGIEADDESVIGDVLFNSIYISIPANKDPRDLTSAINHEIDDMVSETGSYATGTTVTASPTRRQSGRSFRPKKLKLDRSKHHKMSFELEGVSADILAFPPESGEVQSSVDVRVRKLEIFDHLPTSTWRKFATYNHEAGEREVDTSMVHLELLNVRPVADLDASEIVMKLTLLPLRLHVDQDALDFLARFFEFKDDSISPSIAPSAPPFIQRAEVNPVRLRLDYKPKKVDYAGLRSGRTTEFMNFIILDRADMVLRRVILYGVSGFDRLGIMLNNIWSPDVRRNQLGTVLSGLAPVRPLVDVASGVRDLVAVPIREYKKDGRIVRSIQKGAIAFAKTTGTELVNLGAKLAIGTQGILQTAEGMLVSPENQEALDDETKKQLSLYADQPLGIVQGLRGAYASLERDLLLARDAIVAVPGEVMASDSATGAAKAVLKQSPTIILRPAIGASKAVGQTLLGAGNTLDRRNLRRIDDVSVRHYFSRCANYLNRSTRDTEPRMDAIRHSGHPQERQGRKSRLWAQRARV